VNHPSRARHRPGSRGLALWLIVAQLALFGTFGLAHRHAELDGSPAFAAAACDRPQLAPNHARVTELGSGHHRAPADCALCQAVRGTIVSLATAPGILCCTGLCGQAPVAAPLSLPIRLVGLSSTRAPPTL
jgi:hypothetical protein